MRHDIKNINTRLDVVTDDCKTIKSLLLPNNRIDKTVMTVQQIAQKFEHNIPFTQIQEFQKFDAELKSNNNLKLDVVRFNSR